MCRIDRKNKLDYSTKIRKAYNKLKNYNKHIERKYES